MTATVVFLVRPPAREPVSGLVVRAVGLSDGSRRAERWDAPRGAWVACAWPTGSWHWSSGVLSEADLRALGIPIEVLPAAPPVVASDPDEVLEAATARAFEKAAKYHQAIKAGKSEEEARKLAGMGPPLHPPHKASVPPKRRAPTPPAAPGSFRARVEEALRTGKFDGEPMSLEDLWQLQQMIFPSKTTRK